MDEAVEKIVTQFKCPHCGGSAFGTSLRFVLDGRYPDAILDRDEAMRHLREGRPLVCGGHVIPAGDANHPCINADRFELARVLKEIVVDKYHCHSNRYGQPIGGPTVAMADGEHLKMSAEQCGWSGPEEECMRA